MADSSERAPPEVRSFLGDIPTASLNVGLALMSRRGNSVADYLRSVAEVRQPAELMAVQLGYWTQMLDDYREAFEEGVAQVTHTSGAPGEAAPPR